MDFSKQFFQLWDEITEKGTQSPFNDLVSSITSENLRAQIYFLWDSMLDQGQVIPIPRLETEVGTLSFTIIERTPKYYIGAIDLEHSEIGGRLRQVAEAVANAYHKDQAPVRLVFSRDSGRISIRIMAGRIR